MNFGFTADGVAAACGVMVLVGTGASTWIGMLMNGQKKDIDALEKSQIAIKADHESRILQLATEFDNRISALHNDKKDIEKRMSEIEREYTTRSENAAARAEILAAVKSIGDDVRTEVAGLRRDVTHLVERVAKVEVGG